MDHLYYFCLVLLCFHACLFVDALWSSAGKGLTSWLSCVMSNCDVVTFQLLSWVRCRVWLYWFLIFALFLSLMRHISLIDNAIWQLTFGVFVDEDHSKLPTVYWLHKLHKWPYKSHVIANSSLCTTTELSILLTSCLTAIKKHVIKYCTTVYERNYGKNYFGLWKIQVKFLTN